ncbi:MAG: helix-turn-helix domain-containing protein [Spirochaetales bacterium]|nr:helix-turn-helix domain-containing protein [Spirochaetales bacterium]
MNINEYLGKRIKQQREKLSYKQVDIANVLQISPQAVSRWEKGENAPDISLLVPLARLLHVTTDWLLGYYELDNKNIEASVFVSSIMGLTNKMQKMNNEEAVIWMNGFLHQITDSVLNYDGIPVKYLGGGFMGFFAGPNHEKRSILASLLAKKTVSEELTIGLHSGTIFTSVIGHKDYSSKDISGNTVNIAFRILSCKSDTGINASMELIQKAGYKNIKNRRKEKLKGINEPIEICEIITTN